MSFNSATNTGSSWGSSFFYIYMGPWMCSWLSKHQLTLCSEHRRTASDSSWSRLVSSDWLFLLHWAVVGLSPCPSVVVFLLSALRTTLPQGHAPKHLMMVVSRNLNELHLILFTVTFFRGCMRNQSQNILIWNIFPCPFLFLERNVVYSHFTVSITQAIFICY